MRHPGEARRGCRYSLGAPGPDLAAACSDNAVVAQRDGGPSARPAGATELQCSDGVDDDCDGQTDCLDPDCAGRRAAASPAFSAWPAAARVREICRRCRRSTAFASPSGATPRWSTSTRWRARATTASIPIRTSSDVLVGRGGRGDDPRTPSTAAPATCRSASARTIRRRASAFRWGWRPRRPTSAWPATGARPPTPCSATCFSRPGAGRQPVYRLADPNGTGGFFNADYLPPCTNDYSAADYVVGTAARDRLHRRRLPRRRHRVLRLRRGHAARLPQVVRRRLAARRRRCSSPTARRRRRAPTMQPRR